MAQEQKNVQEQDLNQLRKVRREKLAELQGSGKDPFVITKYDQTHHSVEVKENFLYKASRWSKLYPSWKGRGIRRTCIEKGREDREVRKLSRKRDLS